MIHIHSITSADVFVAKGEMLRLLQVERDVAAILCTNAAHDGGGGKEELVGCVTGLLEGQRRRLKSTASI